MVRVRDGVEALEFLLREGACSDRAERSPRPLMPDLTMPRMERLLVLERRKRKRRVRSVV